MMSHKRRKPMIHTSRPITLASRALTIIAPFLFLFVVGPRSAYATHHRWVIDDGGASCHASMNPLDVYYDSGAVWNSRAANVTVVCPVNLGGQFDGWTDATPTAQQQIFHHSTVPIASAQVLVTDNDPNTILSCMAFAETKTGSNWFSRSVSVNGSSTTPNQTIELAPDGDWGGNLGRATSQYPIRSLSYQCNLPAMEGVVGVRRYVTRVCVNNSGITGTNQGCNGNDSTQGTIANDWPKWARVQHNGLECVLADGFDATQGSNVTYSEKGISLSSFATVPSAQVICPLNLATGDSWTNPWPQLARLDIFMTVPSSPAFTPYCDVRYLNDDLGMEGEAINHSQMTYDSATSSWKWSGLKSVGVVGNTHYRISNTYLVCVLAPGSGVEGAVSNQYIGWMSEGFVASPVASPSTSAVAW